MAPVPTEAEIDAMSEEELEAYLAQAPDDPPEEGADDAGGAASYDDGARPAWLCATGFSRAYAWLIIKNRAEHQQKDERKQEGKEQRHFIV